MVKVEDDLPPRHTTPRKNRKSVNATVNSPSVSQNNQPRGKNSLNSSADNSMIK